MDTTEMCALCDNRLGDGEESFTISQKGIDSINRASETRGKTIKIQIGQRLHKKCRQRWVHPKYIELDIKKQSITDEAPSCSRRSSGVFNFKEQCVFCGSGVKYDGKKRGFDVSHVETLEFKDSLLTVCEKVRENDDWSQIVKGRIAYAVDLVSEEAIYHKSCYVNFKTNRNIPMAFSSVEVTKKAKTGRPEDLQRKQAFLEVATYLQENDEEQLTVSDLVNKMKDLLHNYDLEPYSLPYMKVQLQEYFKDQIIVTEINGKRNVVTFLSTAKMVLHEFYSQKSSVDDSESEAARIIETAAKLIKNDIKSVKTRPDYFPSKTDLGEEAAFEYIPKSLLMFLQKVFAGKDNNLKIASIGQAIMQATRPRVLLAPLQFGLAQEMHDHFGSRFIVDSLNKHGFCCSYSEVKKFERSASVVHGFETFSPVEGEFVQFVADNVDHNVRSIDGFNTFHGMGIIASFTPGTVKSKPVPRITVLSDDIIRIGRINIKFLDSHCPHNPPMTYKALKRIEVIDSTANIDILWEASLVLHPSRPTWSGMMQSVQKGSYPGQSAFLFLPMIDMNPGNPNCVYSTLCYISDLAIKNNITPILTFDQPLWYKAMTIVESAPFTSPLKAFILRLGGLHMQMSFLGSIGHLMMGTGLKEVFELVYSENTVKHILSGKAISRAIRAHMLVSAALNAVLLSKTYDIPVPCHSESMELKPTELTYFENNELMEAQKLLEGLLGGSLEPTNVLSSQCITRIAKKVKEMKDNMGEQRTARLWIQYLDMVAILRLFIKAERTGNWELHLDVTRKMLPYFAAAGHNLYAKSAYLYLQKMEELPSSHPDIYRKFMEGLHVVRRSDRYWAGLSTDLAIEQVLMRSLKTTGGLTHGRGMDEVQRMVWTLAMPATAEIKFAMQELTGIRYNTSDQHREATSTRIKRDYTDTVKIISFFQTYDPFTEDPSLHSISSGVFADKKVNVDKARSVGSTIISSMVGKNVNEFKFLRKNQAVTLGTRIPLGNESKEMIQTDPQLLFQRLCVLVNNETSLKEQAKYFEYELCSHPPALFYSSGLPREANKAALADAMWELTSHVQPSDDKFEDVQYVLDGGALLHRISWQRGATFEEITDQYCRYITSRYRQACIVFDGYRNEPSIKDATHRKRAGGCVGVNVSFTPKTVVKLKKNVFLANKENKQMFINLLGKALEKAGFSVLHAKEDADVLIVKTTLNKAVTKETVLIGDDTDLLVLLCYHAETDNHNIFFRPEPKGNTQKRRVWNILETKKALGDLICTNILFIHAILGCDSTSRVYGLGKAAALKKVMKDKKFCRLAGVFGEDSGYSKKDVIEAGEKALVCLYNGKLSESIDTLRIKRFREKVAKSSKYVEAKSLPPTKAATKFHSLRVFYQIQEWKGRNELNSEEWGWKLEDGKLHPIMTDLPAGPSNLLAMIKCNCTTGCNTVKCNCRKHGIDCSYLCGDCKGLHCTNSTEPDIEENELASD